MLAQTAGTTVDILSKTQMLTMIPTPGRLVTVISSMRRMNTTTSPSISNPTRSHIRSRIRSRISRMVMATLPSSMIRGRCRLKVVDRTSMTSASTIKAIKEHRKVMAMQRNEREDQKTGIGHLICRLRSDRNQGVSGPFMLHRRDDAV
jgi:hypothetical protein